MSPYVLLDPFVRAAHAAVIGVAAALPGQPGGAAVAIAVVLVTVTIRACLLPVALSALRAERGREALAPQIARLRARYGHDRPRLAREVTDAYRRAGISPFAGLRPALLQLPVISTMYRVLVVPTVAGHPNAIRTAHLFGAPLAAHWPEVLSVAGTFSAPALAFLVVISALTALAWASVRQLRDRAARAEQAARAARQPRAEEGRLGLLLRLLPYGTVVFAVFSPLAVSVYLLATTAWSTAERRLLPRLA